MFYLACVLLKKKLPTILSCSGLARRHFPTFGSAYYWTLETRVRRVKLCT